MFRDCTVKDMWTAEQNGVNTEDHCKCSTSLCFHAMLTKNLSFYNLELNYCNANFYKVDKLHCHLILYMYRSWQSSKVLLSHWLHVWVPYPTQHELFKLSFHYYFKISNLFVCNCIQFWGCANSLTAHSVKNKGCKRQRIVFSPKSNFYEKSITIENSTKRSC